MAARRLTPGARDAPLHRRTESIVERLAAEAIRRGADFLEVEYKDGYEEVVAGQGGVCYGIARFGSSSPDAMTLREELRDIAKRKWRIVIDGVEYELRGRVYEGFGEDTFRVRLRRV